MLGRNSGFVARSFARIFFVMMAYLVTVSVSVCWKCRVITCVYKLPGIFSLLSVVIQHLCCQAGVTFSRGLIRYVTLR